MKKEIKINGNLSNKDIVRIVQDIYLYTEIEEEIKDDNILFDIDNKIISLDINSNISDNIIKKILKDNFNLEIEYIK